MKKFIMGCGQSLSDEALRNREIGRTLRKDYSMERQIVKLLLLGAGESGKSTVVKQMKLLHAVNDREEIGFSEEERSEARLAIYDNIVDSMARILIAMEELGIKFKSNMFEEDKDAVLTFAESGHSISRPGSAIVRAIENLWSNPEVQLTYARRNEYQLNDSAAYFLSDVARFCKKDYVPSDQDILRTRVKTTGIVKIEFEFKSTMFHMFDVGGQRSERKKWIHCFDNVTAVLFIISLSEYDQVLFEDSSVNRMEESLQLFASVINNIHFKFMPFIVFFNKKDLFEEKLKSKSISLAFPDYQGDDSFDSARDFIVEKYLSQSRVSLRQRAMYPHLTTATDTKLVHKVFTNVTEIILSEVLKDIGLN